MANPRSSAETDVTVRCSHVSRWYVPLGIVAGAVLVVGGAWLRSDRHNPVTVTYLAVAVGLLLLGCWVAFFSGLRWWARLALLLSPAFVVPVGLKLLLIPYRLDGFTADMAPILVRRASGERETTSLDDIIARQGRGAVEIDSQAADDEPFQFLGPTRNGVYQGVGLSRDWDTNPPERIWQVQLGRGWSSFAVRGDYAVTQEVREDQDLIVCYHLPIADIVWVYAEESETDLPEHFSTSVSGAGPRATPTIAGTRVYAVGLTGRLNCLALADGSPVWSQHLLRENGAMDYINDEGVSCSPLVVDDLVVLSAGGPEGRSLVAYDGETGAIRWTAGNDLSGYSSPALFDLAGRKQIVMASRTMVTGHDPSDGSELWAFPWQHSMSNNAAQPVQVAKNRLFLCDDSASTVVEIVAEENDFQVRTVWENRSVKTRFSNAVFYDGFIYALDLGILTCVDPETGKRQWKRGRYGHGHVLLVDDVLLLQSDSGVIALVEPTPDEYREVARFSAMDRRTWSVPVMCGSRLLIRGDGEMACYALPTHVTVD